MSARPRCSPWIDDLSGGRLVVLRPPVLWQRNTIAFSLRKQCCSAPSPSRPDTADAVNCRDGSGQAATKFRSREHKTLDLGHVEATPACPGSEARKAPSSINHVPKTTLATIGHLAKRTFRQILNVHKEIYAYHDHLRSRHQQTLARRNRIVFARRCLGVARNGASVSVHSHMNEEHRDVVFIAIDTEGGNKLITEVGIAILDTRSLAGVSPGLHAREWYRRIRTRHFSTRPYSQRFKFGVTEHVPLAALKPYIKSLISPMRKYVLVGHSIFVDLDKLAPVLGYDLRLMPNVIRQLDTLEIVRGLPMPQKLSLLWKHLAGVAQDRELETRLAFHNAGNDAVYNLHVLLMLVMAPEAEWATPTPRTSFFSAPARPLLYQSKGTYSTKYLEKKPKIVFPPGQATL